MKLPVLITHFNEHKQRDNNVTFVDFLSMHYWGTDIDDHDEDRDSQLPFKTTDIHPIQVFYTPVLREVNLKENNHQFAEMKYPSLNNSLLPDPAVVALFRPPRS